MGTAVDWANNSLPHRKRYSYLLFPKTGPEHNRTLLMGLAICRQRCWVVCSGPVFCLCVYVVTVPGIQNMFVAIFIFENQMLYTFLYVQCVCVYVCVYVCIGVSWNLLCYCYSCLCLQMFRPSSILLFLSISFSLSLSLCFFLSQSQESSIRGRRRKKKEVSPTASAPLPHCQFAV